MRKATGLTADQAAEQLGFSRSKISRLENGRRGASKADILRLCELYQVDEEQCLRLTELAAEGKQRVWWQTLSLQYSDYVGLEAAAASISDYGLAIVPGLLQTPGYARSILSAAVPALEPRIVEQRVRARLARQQLLFSSEGPRFDAVLDESVLHRVVGGPVIMLDQLKRLLQMSDLPAVTIRVVPYDAGSVPAGVNKFIILQFAEPDTATVVLIEELTSHRCLEQPDQVLTYSATFRALARLSADPDASREMILTKITSYESKIR